MHDQVDMYLTQIPRLLYMQHYPLAKAFADWANANGGKSPKGGKKLPESQLFKPEDFLFHMAKYSPYLEEDAKPTQSMGIDPQTAKLIVTLNMHQQGGKRASKLEPWMIAAFGGHWGEIVEVAEN